MIWLEIVLGVLTIGGVLSYQMFTFKRQNQQIDRKVSRKFCESQHVSHDKEFADLKGAVGDITDALQGKTGETGLVSAVQAIAITVGEIRTHQQNGGDR